MAGTEVDAAVNAALGDALRQDAAASPPEHRRRPGPSRQIRTRRTAAVRMASRWRRTG